MPSDPTAPEAGHSTAALIAQAFETLDALRRAGRLADAERLGLQLVGEFPDLAEAWNRLGVVQAELGQGLQAVASLERAIELAPRDPSHRANLAEVLRRGGLAARALGHGQAAVELDSNHVASRVNLAYALLDVKRAADALPHFEHACQRDPHHPQAWFGRGRALVALRRLSEAGPGALHHAGPGGPGAAPGTVQCAPHARPARGGTHRGRPGGPDLARASGCHAGPRRRADRAGAQRHG
jgi:tetratricopeptide (TPR) repeat protein